MAKRIALFPLEIPAYVLRGAFIPLHELTRLMERKKVVEHLVDYYGKSNVIFYPIFQAGGGDGIGGGFGMTVKDLFHSEYRLSLDYTIFTDTDQRAGFTLSSPDYSLAGRPFRYKFTARFSDKDNAKYYGVGANSLKANEGLYAFDRVRTGFALEFEVLPHLTLAMPLEFLAEKTKASPGGSHPSVQDVFPPNELTAFGQRTNYAHFGLEITHDTRDAVNTPSHGGYRSLRFTRFQGLDSNQFSFNEIEVDIRQFFQVWTPRHVIAVRNDWVFQQGAGSGGIPFEFLAKLDVNSPLRGFSSGRFRDSASVLFNFEYRFPIWDYIDGTLFVDTGKVFHGISNFNFDHWRYSVGGGIRVFYQDNFIMRLQGGYGGEGAVVVFRVGESI